MDYSFYALVAICIFLLILTFYLAVRRRRHAKRREAQNRSHEPIVNNDYEPNYYNNNYNNNASNVPGIIAIDMPPTPQRPIGQQDYHSPYLSEYSTMTNRPHSSSNPPAAYKPEDMPQPPPPSYQDYAKDVRIIHSPPHR